MKRFFATISVALSCLMVANAQEPETQLVPNDDVQVSDTTQTTKAKKKKAKKEKSAIKTGYNFGPLPAIAFDADKGFQLGAILNIYNFGDGSNYPNYDSKIYIEGSYFTKGSQLYQLMYDNKTLIPGVRWSSAASVTVDKAMDFYGFGGYANYFDQDRIALGKKNKKQDEPDPMNYIFTPFYRLNKLQVLAKTDFVGEIGKGFKWEVGYHFGWFKMDEINRTSINKGKKEYNTYPSGLEGDDRGYANTFLEVYKKLGLIDEKEANGGFMSSIRAGFQYDSRDKEGAPTRGIWADAHAAIAPKWLGTTSPFYRYSLTFRHYIPLTKKQDQLTFAYRLNYEGTFGNKAPYYVLPFITVMGENGDKDGFGGYRTCRGILRNRVVGLDVATWNVELRWRFVNFRLWNQNIAFGLSAFCDGTWVTRNRSLKISEVPQETIDAVNEMLPKNFTSVNDLFTGKKDLPHSTIGAGLRFIMNENFIVAFEYGSPISHMLPKTHWMKDQDGTGAFYINIGYLF